MLFVYEAMTNNAAVILAAGQGTRMNSKTPKVLHQVCGIEMVRMVVNAARSAAIEHIVAVVPEEHKAITDALQDSVSHVVQTEQLGTGHALLQSESLLKQTDNVIVLAGDVPLIRPDTIEAMLQLHNDSGAAVTMLTSKLTDPSGLGRVVRSSKGQLQAVVEEIDADESVRLIAEINGGIYCFDAAWMYQNLHKVPAAPNGEIYLTSLIAQAVEQRRTVESVLSDDMFETVGVNNRVQLAQVETEQRRRIREKWMLAGVTIPDPESVYIDATAKLGRDVTLLANTHIRGKSQIGESSEIGPNSMVYDSTIGSNCKIIASMIEQSQIDDEVDVGPFSHIRPDSHLERGVHIGNFAEVKNSRVGAGSASGHFSYIGDSDLGENVNIGAGTVTCNFDGEEKHTTTVRDNAFVGSGSMLIAPVEIGEGASTGAGAVVNRDVPKDSLWVGDRRDARVIPKRKKSSNQGE